MFILANSRLPCGIIIYQPGAVAISFNYQGDRVVQNGFFDKLGNVSVGPVSADVVAKTRRSCEGENAPGDIIISYVLCDNEKYDCTYPEWVQQHRANTIRSRTQQIIERMGTDLGLQFVPWDAVEAVAKASLGDMAGVFLASLCHEMQLRTESEAGKTAWLARGDTYGPSVATPE